MSTIHNLTHYHSCTNGDATNAMKKLTGILCLAAATTLTSAALTSAALTSAAPAQQTRDQAVGAMRKVEAKEMDATYTQAAPFAQKLINEALAKHPEILLIAIHATPPGHKNVIVASNFGRIGKIGDEDDMRCIRTGKSNLEIAPTGDHFEDELILLDASGKTIGALGVVFNYKPGDDKEAMQKIANTTRDEMKTQLPSAKALFGPAW
jgi:hypothetical protein